MIFFWKARFFSLLLFFPFLFSCSNLRDRQNLQGNDQVLQWMMGGKTALDNGQTANAFSQWQKAADLLDQIWANKEGAKKAGSLWYGELAKEFRGEPYERMMLYFYLGILFYQNEDYGNAQAAFKQISIQGQEAKTVEAQYVFRLALLLEAFALKALNSEGGYQNALQLYLAQGWELPFSLEKPPQALVIFEGGTAPKKEWQKSPEKLIYQDTNSKQDLIDLSLDGVSKIVYRQRIFDIAQAKGLREADKYAQGKSQTKDVTQKTGNVATQIGSNLAGSDSGDKLAAALIVGGLAAQIFSYNIVVQGDTRAWVNLPGYLYYSFLNLPPDKAVNLQVKKSDSLDNPPFFSQLLTSSSSDGGRVKILYIPSGK